MPISFIFFNTFFVLLVNNSLILFIKIICFSFCSFIRLSYNSSYSFLSSSEYSCDFAICQKLL